MPTVLRDGPYRLHFFAGDRGEPRHVHVDRDGAEAKFWLDPDVRLARNRNYGSAELRKIERLVRDHLDDLRAAWDGYFAT